MQVLDASSRNSTTPWYSLRMGGAENMDRQKRYHEKELADAKHDKAYNTDIGISRAAKDWRKTPLWQREFDDLVHLNNPMAEHARKLLTEVYETIESDHGVRNQLELDELEKKLDVAASLTKNAKAIEMARKAARERFYQEH